MSANIVAGFFRLLRAIVLLFVAILSSALVFASDSTANPGTGRLLLKADLAAEPIKEYVLFRVGDAQGSLKLESVTNSTASHSNALHLTVTKVGDRCGVLFVRGVEAEANQWYDLAFRARTDKRENDHGYGLTVSLEGRDGKQVFARTTLPEVGGEWRDYTVALHSRLAHSAAVFTITMSEPGAIWFDQIELRQRQTGREKRTP